MDELQKMLTIAIREGTFLEPAYLMYIDFDDLQGQYNNTFQSALIDFADLPKYKYVSLFQASIQKTYYMIQSGYNTMVVNGSTITIPPGNYTYITLSAALLTELNTLGFGAWTITFNQTTGKYTFSNATPGMYFTFSTSTDMELRLGFSNGTHTFTAGELTSTLPINLQLTNVIVIQSSLVKSKAQNSINQQILMSIPDASVISSPVTFENTDPHGLRVPIADVGTQFNINLFDANNRPLGIQSGCNLVLAFYIA